VANGFTVMDAACCKNLMCLILKELRGTGVTTPLPLLVNKVIYTYWIMILRMWNKYYAPKKIEIKNT
jgi:hypothetical protein